MAQHYEVEEGKSLVIDGPANIIVKTGKVPIIGTPARAAEGKADGEEAQKAQETRKSR
jgi:hypothetical protein